MATAIASGCDSLSYVNGDPTAIVATQYGGTNQNGSVGPSPSTFMSFVGKYVDAITSAQLTAFNNAGVSVYFYMENGSIQSNSFFAGISNTTAYNQGVTDAGTAISSLGGLGLSSTQPVYFAMDFNANSSAFPNVGFYFQGIIDTVGASANVGIYGSGYCCTNVNEFLNGSGYPSLGYFIQSKSNGYTGNGSYLGGTTGTTQNLWQWPPGANGYSPSGNLTINGHGFDGVFAYTSYFGQYPSTPGSGVLTNATVTQPQIVFTQPQAETIIVPKYNYDHVLFSKVWEQTIVMLTGSQSLDYGSTGIGQYAYPIGNFTATINGVSETNDFGFVFSGDYGSNAGNLPTVTIQPIVDASGNLTFDVTAPLGETVELTINIALMATYSPIALPSTSVAQQTAYSNIIPGGLPTPYATYRRISEDSYVGTGLSKVPHNLNTVPNILVWVQDNTGTLEMQPTSWGSAGHTGSFGVSMDSTNVYMYIDSGLNTYGFYRLYLDD